MQGPDSSLWNNDLGEIAAYGEAFFAVAPETLETARTKAVKLAGAAVLIIILTAGLVYPVVITLLNRVSSLSAKLFESNLEMLKVLGSAVAKRDSDTDSHNYKGEQIPQIARIFSIADVFDALASRRPYKKPFSFEKAMDIIIAGRGNHFDPVYVDAFEKIALNLFDTYAKREDDTLKTELAALLKAYFHE